MHNFTADAHPIHIHEVQFQVVNRQPFDGAAAAAGALGDRVQGHRHRLSRRDHPGQGDASTCPGRFVWHCHIVEHEDNEMMRPYFIGTPT